jgi:hypothetical protein
MKKSNIAHAIAKAMFNLSFIDGIVLPEVITLAKSWPRKNMFTPAEILKQMDI